MKKFIFYSLLILVIVSYKVSAEEIDWSHKNSYGPMPVLFIHGINANSLTWDTATKELEKYFGYKWKIADGTPEGKPITNDNKAVTLDRENKDAPQNKVVKHYLEAFDYGGEDKMGSFKGLDEYNTKLDNEVKKVLQAYYGNNYSTSTDKLIIVTHSQGGLIARYYIQHGGAGKVKRLITIGTPHRGSNMAVPPRIIGLPSNLPTELLRFLESCQYRFNGFAHFPLLVAPD